jgi:hypothetical protein
MIGELLWSSRNGWFSTHPLTYAGFVGLFFLPKRARLVGIGLLAVVAIQIYFNSTVIDWWSSASFGQRRMCNVSFALVVGLAALIWRFGRLAARAPRIPRAVWHAVLIILLAPFVAWNLWRVSRLEAGKPATMQRDSMCCDDVPRHLRGMFRTVYRAIGDPFQLPASLVFGIRHGVEIQRYDQVVGDFYPLVPPWTQLSDAQLPSHRATLQLGAGYTTPLVVSGLDRPISIDKRAVRKLTAPAATVLLPNLMPYGQRCGLWLHADHWSHATIRFNGDTVDDADLMPGWTKLTFALPDIALHTNELSIEAEPGTGLSDLEMTFLPR